MVAPGQAPVKSSGVTVWSPALAVSCPTLDLDRRKSHRVFSGAGRAIAGICGRSASHHDTWVVSTEPRRLTTGADLQTHASIVRGTRLVFSSLTQTINVWSLPLGANTVASWVQREG